MTRAEAAWIECRRSARAFYLAPRELLQHDSKRFAAAATAAAVLLRGAAVQMASDLNRVYVTFLKQFQMEQLMSKSGKAHQGA